jgi:hypothetical protein
MFFVSGKSAGVARVTNLSELAAAFKPLVVTFLLPFLDDELGMLTRVCAKRTVWPFILDSSLTSPGVCACVPLLQCRLACVSRSLRDLADDSQCWPSLRLSDFFAGLRDPDVLGPFRPQNQPGAATADGTAAATEGKTDASAGAATETTATFATSSGGKTEGKDSGGAAAAAKGPSPCELFARIAAKHKHLRTLHLQGQLFHVSCHARTA